MKNPFLNRTPYNLMTVCLGSLGDILNALPAFEALKRRYPKTRRVWVVDSRYAPVLRRLEGVEEVVEYDLHSVVTSLTTLERFWQGWEYVWSFVRRLRDLRLTGAVNFTPGWRASFFTWMSGARIRFGFKGLFRLSFVFHNQREPLRADLHQVERNLLLLKSLSMDAPPIRPVITLRPGDSGDVTAFLNDHALSDQRYVVVFTTAAQATTQWKPEAYAELCDRFHEEAGLTPVVAWGEGGEDFAREVMSRVRAPVLLAPHFDLLNLGALFARSALAVGAESGPLQLASLFNTPVVVLYGPGDTLTGPYWEPFTVVRFDPECRRTCRLSYDTTRNRCRCLNALGARQVFDACRPYLTPAFAPAEPAEEPAAVGS